MAPVKRQQAKRNKAKTVKAGHPAKVKKMSNRPATRTLVRWNDDLDKSVLMWLVYCSNEQGIKLPFARVAQCMGSKFSEGAIIQHLAKIRTKMEEEGLNVPPPHKRGTVTRTGSSIYRPKPKGLDDPIPRARSSTASAARRFATQGVENELDNEEDHNLDTIEGIGSKRNSRPAQPRKSSVVVKYDSEEDEPLPALFHSDNEDDAQMPTAAPAKNAIARTVQMKLHFKAQPGSMTNCYPELHAGSELGKYDSGNVGSAQASPRLKYESMENVPARQGTRRKSSAMKFDNDDDADEDYVPEPDNKPRNKKTKSRRSTKKQKTGSKNNVGSDNDKEEALMTGYDEASNYDADRAAMPPPTLPSANIRTAVTWRPRFMQHPFEIQNGQEDEFNDVGPSEGKWNDFSLTSSSAQGVHLPYMGGSAIQSFNPYFNYYAPDLPATVSAANSRNHSFASAGSDSTIESQPVSWNQTLRSPGFPNPREASRFLHIAVNAPGPYRATGNGDQMLPLWNGNDQYDSSQLDTSQQAGVDGDDTEAMFVGMPETGGETNNEIDDNSLMSMFLNESMFSECE